MRGHWMMRKGRVWSQNYHKFTISISGYKFQWSFFLSFEAKSKSRLARSSPSLWSIQLAVFVRPIRLRSILKCLEFIKNSMRTISWDIFQSCSGNLMHILKTLIHFLVLSLCINFSWKHYLRLMTMIIWNSFPL